MRRPSPAAVFEMLNLSEFELDLLEIEKELQRLSKDALIYELLCAVRLGRWNFTSEEMAALRRLDLSLRAQRVGDIYERIVQRLQASRMSARRRRRLEKAGSRALAAYLRLAGASAATQGREVRGDGG